METSLQRIFEFLDYTAKKSFFSENTAASRRTACNNFFDVLDEDQRSVEYVKDNIDTIAHRVATKNRDRFTGQTIEAYKSRVKKTLEDFCMWSDNKVAWERGVATRGKEAPKVKPKRTDRAAASMESTDLGENSFTKREGVRHLSFPMRPDFEVKVSIPQEGLTGDELQRLGMFLLPYCRQFSPEAWKNLNWPTLKPENGAN